MTHLETIREALELALREHNELMAEADLPTGSLKIEAALTALATLESEKPSDRDGACPKCGPVGCAECNGTGRMSGYTERQSSPEAKETP